MNPKQISLIFPWLIWFGCGDGDDSTGANKQNLVSGGQTAAGSSSEAGSAGSPGASGQGGASGSGGAASTGGAGQAGGAGVGGASDPCDAAPVHPTEPCTDCVPFNGAYVDLAKKCRQEGVVACFASAVEGGGEIPDCLGVTQGGQVTGCLCRGYQMTPPPGSGLVELENYAQVCLMNETLPSCSP